MSHTHPSANTIEYSLALVQAGVTGFHRAQSASQKLSCDLADAATAGLRAAAVGGGIALLGCHLARRRNRRSQAALALAGFAFCLEFLWRSRAVSATLISGIREEVSKTRDQHWLALNPVDYA